MYCYQKLGLQSKPRLWYNITLTERSIRWQNENEETLHLSLKPRSFSRLSAVKVHRSPNCVDREPNLTEDQLSKWKQQLLENAASVFESRDKTSEDAAEQIAHLEQLVG